ncbi:hypothetical protein EFL95_04985 [Nocardioides marmorisolisilvae]|uniref:Peptidase M10 metallopeptidase domain-containing protein n=1 Tax=Nocardioides marmorisolisilvae TaxID=1542737 RepID=A0A3N0DS45_9ACTN|nr:hypothetical protein EFL95_04985 [Nocardioides marmorisolisilvae]
MMRRPAFISVATVVMLAVSMASSAAANHWNHDPGHNVHWTNSSPSFPRGYVYWADLTGPEWPVYSAAIEWDRSTRLDAVYVGAGSSCPSTPHCVTVRQTALGTSCSGTLGQTNVSYYSATGHLETSTRVDLSSACSTSSASKRRTITCHELGHSIGMDEQRTADDSCMVDPYVTPHTLPSAHDFQSIATVYNHDD